MSAWIDCDVQMPPVKDDEASFTVLCWLCTEFVISGWRSYSDGEWYDLNGEIITDVYFWQPLPEEPETD